ncbi:MAG: Uma2 family endonuclease [Isosphaeraceae bacterium]|nr:Uma2 family endonuclease [Isosphaeraceae bacterium]
MPAALTSSPVGEGRSSARTLAGLLEQLGDIPLRRVRIQPPLGTATEQDLINADPHEDGLCELVDGVLVEKAMGLRESLLAAALLALLRGFVDPPNLGLVTGAGGTFGLFPGLVRIPDVAFISWARIPGGRVPAEPIPQIAPDLAVEVLSEGNTPKEMERKRREYFAAGVRLVWMIDPEHRTVTIFTGPDQSTTLDTTQTLEGGDVLPGFHVALTTLFAELDRQGPQGT